MQEQFGYLRLYDLKLEREISRGTFGVVFLAQRVSCEEKVAVKVFFQSVSSSVSLQELLFARLLKDSPFFL